MFQVGDYVMKVNNGVCHVEDIETKNMMGEEKQYYLLVPRDDKSARLYVPVNAKNDNIRFCMTKTEAVDFIKQIPDIEMAWIESDKVREQEYKDAIRSGSPSRLVSIIKNIYLRNLKRTEQGKKTTTIDDRYYKMAEKILYSELEFALEKDKSEIVDIISNSIEG